MWYNPKPTPKPHFSEPGKHTVKKGELIKIKATGKIALVCGLHHYPWLSAYSDNTFTPQYYTAKEVESTNLWSENL
jgi:hypothetical protein